jgi:hypothetical protein
VISLYTIYLTTLSVAQATIKVYGCVILSFCMGMKPGLSHKGNNIAEGFREQGAVGRFLDLRRRK